MRARRLWRRGAAGAAVAGMSLCVLWGCGDDGPTEPKTISLPELFGSTLYRASGSTVGVGTLASTPVIGIFFASSGCPACASFTPILVDAYDQLKAEGKPFEVVLVTGGMTEAALLQYMTDSGMPWLAVPPGSRPGTIADRYRVRWVPTLIVINGEGETLTTEGREELVQSGPAAYDSWRAAGGG